jgi:hypothetical protein
MTGMSKTVGKERYGFRCIHGRNNILIAAKSVKPVKPAVTIKGMCPGWGKVGAMIYQPSAGLERDGWKRSHRFDRDPSLEPVALDRFTTLELI